jgi:succinyl-CoA synthetase alpha subunit
MSILINKDTRVICQGITGKAGAFHTRQCKDYGTKMVAGVTPGKGGTEAEGLPVYDTVHEAVVKHQATASLIFVPAFAAADSIEEAVTSGIKLVVCITEHIPQQDMMRATETVAAFGATLIGHSSGLHSQKRFGWHRQSQRNADL